jgi:hypothetical protein
LGLVIKLFSGQPHASLASIEADWMVIAKVTIAHQLQENLKAAIIPAQALASERTLCPSCGQSHPKTSKFCNHCGQAKAGPVQPPPVTTRAPAFAHAASQKSHGVPAELQEELGGVLIAVARERLFLYFHWLVFLGVHALGFVLAFMMYQDFAGDETSKILFALPPLFFFNVTAFFCLPVIKSTRFQIARLKEKLTYLHYRIEYHELY